MELVTNFMLYTVTVANKKQEKEERRLPTTVRIKDTY